MTRPRITPLHLAAVCLPVTALLEYSSLALPDHWSALEKTLVIRSLQSVVLSAIILTLPGAAALAGFSRTRLARGLILGVKVSVLFGFLAGMTGGVIWLFSINPLDLIRFSIPRTGPSLVLFLITGGIIGPIAEEILFRGVLYTCLRPFGLAPAVVLSTLIFALFHFQGNGLPVVQCIGGVVFALSFERSGHIATPVIVHSTGNLALFGLCLLSP